MLAAVPPGVPNLINHASVRAFNEMWFRKAPRRRQGEIQSITRFFHPLDGIAAWNRVYGRHGFLQYQFVVPFGQEAALRGVIERVVRSGHASFVAVLKRFGPGNAGPLSFPMAGWTLTVDLPAGAGGLSELLHDLDYSRARRRWAPLPGEGLAHHAGIDPPRLSTAARMAGGAAQGRPGWAVDQRHRQASRADRLIGASNMRNALDEPQTIVVLGGTSDIGLAIATALSGPATRHVVLACRDTKAGLAAADALDVGSAEVTVVPFEANDAASHPGFVDDLAERFGDLDVVVLAFGVLGDQATFDADPVAAAAAVTTNYSGAVSVGLAVARRLRAQGHGRSGRALERGR